MRNHSRVFAALAATLATTAMAWSVAGPVAAQDKAARYDRIVASYEVQPDGRVSVVEEQTVDFRGGPFTTGYVRLDTRGASDVTVTAVGEREPDRAYRPGRDEPYTYDVRRDGDEVEVRWWFPATSDAKRRFVVAYTLDGALRFYEGGDQFWWKAIRPDQPATDEAIVTVALPGTVPAITLAEGYWLPDGRRLEMSPVDPRTARLRVADVPSGDEVEVRVQWPHGLVAGTPSPFQAELDAERAAEQAQIEAMRSPARVILGLVIVLLALLVLLGGAFGLYLLWYHRGRDRPTAAPADYLAEPPSDLGPGLVGTLLDESADLKDVLATLVDLCRRGEARLEEKTEEGFLGLMGRQDFILHRTGTGASLAGYEQAVLEAFLDGGESRAFSDLKEKFYKELPALQRELYAGVVAAGLFAEDPEAVRNRYRWLGCGGLLVAALLLAGSLLVFSWLPVGIVLPGVVAALAVATFVVGHFMPAKTPAGAEAAALWRAFRRYLDDIDTYRDLGEARDIFDRYLPYAVAFGLDQSWIRKFAAAGAEGPPWFDPDPSGGRGWGVPGRPWIVGGGGGGEGAGGGGGVPDLQRGSESLGRGLQGMSGALATMLNSAAVVMTSQPQSSGSGWSGGGWSGGGFSGGGGGGGGGGGFG